MIPYTDLVAALRHWRARNGLPIAGGDVGPPPSAWEPRLPGPPPALERPYADASGVLGGDTMDAEELGVQEIDGEEIYDQQPDYGASPGGGYDSQFSSSYNESYGDTGTGTGTDAGPTEPNRYGAGYHDEYAAPEPPGPPPPPKPQGIIVDPDTHDMTVPDEDAPAPSGKKKKRRR